LKPSTPLFFESERGRGGKGKLSFPVKRKFSLSTAHSFTLIELLVSTVISSLHFLTPKTTIETEQRIPLFLKRGVGFGERGKTSFPVKRSFSPLPKSAFTLIDFK